MHYLIDGHNLIGRSPDIELEDPDDEVKLVLKLRSWAARGRKRRVTVVFDRGLPGGKDKGLSTGTVQVIFAAGGQTADTILIKRIRAVRNAQEYTLVSGDRRIIQEATARRMPVWTAVQFIERMDRDKDQEGGAKKAAQDLAQMADPRLSEAELAMWLDLFDAPDEANNTARTKRRKGGESG
jgi:predicted RNA-binding protein with PIN domain